MSRIILKPTTAKLSLVALLKQGTAGGGGGPGGATGWLLIHDVQAQGGGVVSAKTYQDPPNDTVVETCTTSTLDIILSIRSSFPLVTVNTDPPTLATLELSADGGHYYGDVDATVEAGPTIVKVTTPDGREGASDTISVDLQVPPELLTLQFTGNYPGSQTELKAGDTFQITGTTDIDADAVEIQDFGACVIGLHTFAVGTSFTATGTIANRGTTPQLLAARVRARNAAGAFGSTRDTNTGGGTTEKVNVIKLNNLYPTVSIGTITYPGAQGAIKATESATVANTLANYDTVLYDSPNGNLSIANPSTPANPKTASWLAGVYNVSTNNFRITANRVANDATTISQTVVKIANVAAVITVSEPAARLRSGGNNGTSAQNHTITVSSDQQLANAPSLDPDTGGGAWSGGWSGGPSSWARSLQVHDNDVKGSYTWQNLVATNLAGIVTNTISGDGTYVLGGFVARSLTFPTFSQQTALNVAAITYAKLQAGIFTATNQSALRNASQGNHSNIVNTYTVDSLGTNPTTLWWNDFSAAASNSSGTAQITSVEETV